MTKQFETEKEAQRALDTARLDSLGWCPLVKHICKKECICYYEGSIRHQEPNQFRQFELSKEYWFVYYPGCTNVLISGVITVEN